MKFQKLKTEGSSEALGIRRNDYIASIRSDISELTTELSNYQELKRQCLELIRYCSDNKLRKCKKVAKRELKLLNKKHDFQLRHKKRLEGLLAMAYECVPGARRE